MLSLEEDYWLVKLKKNRKDQDLDTILLEGDEIEIPCLSKEVFNESTKALVQKNYI